MKLEYRSRNYNSWLEAPILDLRLEDRRALPISRTSILDPRGRAPPPEQVEGPLPPPLGVAMVPNLEQIHYYSDIFNIEFFNQNRGSKILLIKK